MPMMQLPKFSVVTAEGLAEPYGSGKSWMQPSLFMQSNKASRSGSEPGREPFTTIDDLLQKTQELLSGLQKLSEYRHPLQVRRGVRKEVKKRMSENGQSRQIKGSGRTYFLDIESTREGKPYLRITESRKGKGDKFERNGINVFPEDADQFAQVVSEMIAGLNTEETT